MEATETEFRFVPVTSALPPQGIVGASVVGLGPGATWKQSHISALQCN